MRQYGDTGIVLRLDQLSLAGGNTVSSCTFATKRSRVENKVISYVVTWVLRSWNSRTRHSSAFLQCGGFRFVLTPHSQNVTRHLSQTVLWHSHNTTTPALWYTFCAAILSSTLSIHLRTPFGVLSLYYCPFLGLQLVPWTCVRGMLENTTNSTNNLWLIIIDILGGP